MKLLVLIVPFILAFPIIQINEELIHNEKNVNIFVNYDHQPGEKELKEIFSITGKKNHYICKFIDTISIEDVPLKKLDTIRKLQGVVDIEIQPELKLFLDISVPTIKVRGSDIYKNNVWDLGYKGEGITVAILDTGVDNRLHESLDDIDDLPSTDDKKFVAGYDSSGTIGFETDPIDNDGHGTHVAGIAIGTGGHTEYKGVAPKAKLVDVKVMEGRGTYIVGRVIRGIDWCIVNKDKYGIDILSMSFGSVTPTNGNDTLSKAVNAAVDAGFIVVCAVGNNGPNVGISSPASADSAIAVGATDDIDTIYRNDDYIASYSSVGPREDDKDFDTEDELKPDIVAPGTNIFAPLAGTPAGYISLSGTSMATPHVSGLVALMLEAYKNLTSTSIKKILHRISEARGVPYKEGKKYNVAYGYGIADGYGAVKRADNLKTGNIEGPSSLLEKNIGFFKVSINYTRTEYITELEKVKLSVSIPKLWSQPEKIELSSEGNYSSSFYLTDEGINWEINACFNYSNLAGEYNPTISFQTKAPATLVNTTYNIDSNFKIDGINGSQYSHKVVVVPSNVIEVDLSVSNISFSTSNPDKGENITINATILNSGTVGISSNVSFYDGPVETGIKIGTDFFAVRGGEEKNVSVRWHTSAGRHKINVFVDPENLVNETNEENNIAEKEIYVKGINEKPITKINLSKVYANVGEKILWDASSSIDKDGKIVLYYFDFGDGNNSGWIKNSKIEYAYSYTGKFNGFVTVEDNGGERDTAEVSIEIINYSKFLSLYMAEEELTFYVPKELKTHICPNGFVPILPGSDIGYTEWRDVGNWSTKKFEKDTAISGKGYLRIWLRNSGNKKVENAEFEFIIKKNNENLFSNLIQMNLSIGEEKEVFSKFSLNETSLEAGKTIVLSIRAKLNGDDVFFLYGAEPYLSGIGITFVSKFNVKPVANAGDDITTQVNKTVFFKGYGMDVDGEIVEYRWDFDSDNFWDYVGESSTAEHVYNKSGKYKAILYVLDNENEYATDDLKIEVKELNRLPTILSQVPKENELSLYVNEEKTFSIVPYDPDNDILTISWYVNLNHSGSGQFYKFCPSKKGIYEIVVVVSDGIGNASFKWQVNVYEKNNPPIIDEYSPKTDISISEGDSIVFNIIAYDPEGKDIICIWKLNSEIVGKGSKQLYSSYTFFTDYNSAGNYTIEVAVSDGEIIVSHSWNITVIDLNRAPTFSIIFPIEGSKYKIDKAILFYAEGNDLDNDKLTYRWVSDRDGEIGNESMVRKSLTPGKHEIKLFVSDGKVEKIG
ncbi:MAG: S8 family serine peptidase, partial [Candidatus Thermoplasmatota archaeon]